MHNDLPLWPLILLALVAAIFVKNCLFRAFSTLVTFLLVALAIAAYFEPAVRAAIYAPLNF